DRDYQNVRDLDKDPIVVWQDKYYWTLAFVLNVGLTTAIGFLLGDPVGGLLIMGFLRLVTCHHTTFFINSLAHTWGNQPYSDQNTSRDNPVIALLTYGEGYHNFHHTFQWDYRNGIRWYHFDPTKWLINALSWLKLTWNLKRIAPEKIEQSMAAMQLKKASASIARYRLGNKEQWLQLLETEYDQLVHTLNEWARCRQDWVDLKRADIKRRWDETELHKRLLEIEENLEYQRRQWRMLTQQFA
ncbi:MAG: acyl-CoA desaturase, partial [Pseudomonadales bacterium]|nr:acyl-CoA desaturase [Pseudomonadales bacterium]